MKAVRYFLILCILGTLFIGPALGLEASFNAGPVLQVGSDSERLSDSGGFKFAAVLNFPLKTDVWEMAPLISITNVNGAPGTGINSISSVGWDLGIEVHPWRGFIVTPIFGGFIGPVFISRNTTSGSTSEFGGNVGAYIGGAFRTGSLTFLAKGMYEYVASGGSGSPSSFSSLSALVGVEIVIDILFGL